jgi:class 3 adenylate cyclase
VALDLTFDYFALRHYAVGNGWLAKATRLLADEPECREHGVLADALAHLQIPQGQLDEALAGAREVFAMGQRLGDADLQARGLSTEGTVLIRLGQVTEGMARIDESMASAVGGELAPYTTAAIYCTTISACDRIGDLRRATEWTDAAEHCAQRPGMQDFPGDCRAHRVRILRVAGQWDDVEAAAESAAAVEGAESSHVATVHSEVGEMRLLRGLLDAADEAFCRAEDLGRTPQPGRALLCLARGEIAAAVSFITAALADESWDRLARTRLLPAQVEIALAADRLGEARQAADELLDIAETYDTIAFSATAQQAQGRVLGAEGDTTAAASCLRDAERLWLELPAPYEAARSRLALAETLRELDRIDEAQAEARAALAAFERLGAIPDEQHAHRLLDEFDQARSARADKVARVTRTFLFTDIVGSTNLLEAMGDSAWRDLVRWHDQVLRGQFSAHGGEEIDHAGDGFFVAFESVDAALDCAITIQRDLARHRREHGFSPGVRIGVHLAEATSDAEGYSGLGVHHAARLGGLAQGDEILVSQETIQAATSPRKCTDARSVSLKGIAEPESVVSLTW